MKLSPTDHTIICHKSCITKHLITLLQHLLPATCSSWPTVVIRSEASRSSWLAARSSFLRWLARSFVLGLLLHSAVVLGSCWPAEVEADCVRSCPQVRTVVLMFLCVCSYSVAQCERCVPLPISVLGQLPSASVGVVESQRSEISSEFKTLKSSPSPSQIKPSQTSE